MASGHATVGTVNVPDLIDTDDEGEDDDCVNNSVDALIDSSSDKCDMSDPATETPSEAPASPSVQTLKPPPMPDPKPK